MTTEQFIEKAIELFDDCQKADAFGLDGKKNLELVCKYEDEMSDLICKHKGHCFVPDQCGIPSHDYCERCGKRRDEIEENQ